MGDAFQSEALQYFTASRAMLQMPGEPSQRSVSQPYIGVDKNGMIVEILAVRPSKTQAIIQDLGHAMLLPGFVNAHSHAFQRAIRGQTARRWQSDPSDFWSWRNAMYACANRLDEEGVYAITRSCFEEMLASGITCVGEFHYLHHRPDGSRYPDPNALSKAVISAAKDSGISLVLLDVYYEQAGPGRPSLPEQRRFCDPSVDAYLERIDELRMLCDTTLLGVGITPHSIRAVLPKSLEQLASYAKKYDLMMHSHVSEQVRENQECMDAYGCTPLSMFEQSGCLEREHRFCAVHAVHLDDADMDRLSRQLVCACPTTEADLGDGIVPASDLLRGGTIFSLGSDSNSLIDLITEARLLEMHERLRLQRRLCLEGASGVAQTIYETATSGGARALGRNERGVLAVGSPMDIAVIDLDHRRLVHVEAEYLLDAIFLSGDAGLVRETWVSGRRVAVAKRY